MVYDKPTPRRGRSRPSGVKAGAVQTALPFAGDSHTHFTREELLRLAAQVWEHGRVMPGIDETTWRQDACGAWIRRDRFGDEADEFGWKIERVTIGDEPDSRALRPFHCRNGYDLANSRPHCLVTADRAHVAAERDASPPRNKDA